MRFKQLQEGYKVLPPINREKYPEVPGLEGPFRTLSGAVVYYDPKEGSYYDKDRDVYLSYDEFRELDNDYSGMKDERDIATKEEIELEGRRSSYEVFRSAQAKERNKKYTPPTKAEKDAGRKKDEKEVSEDASSEQDY